ncbi:MAG: prenyltransferase/squalene oxidase repeat-containing protein, partial [Campylobacterota bacterium]|nr:prenyltransferase/squalene oxidase repeat-containing protein [Campylobacterota bacterium]
MFFIRVFLLYLLITVSINALNLDSSRIWLKNSLNSNLSNHDIATPYQIYKEARLIMDDSRGDTKVLFASELNTTEFLANKIIAYKESNLDTIHLVEQLKILQNSDGGFGHTKGHQSNPIDSALALEAISWIDNNTITHSLVSYLLSQQKSNGSWQDAIITDDTIYTTSIVLRALWLERKSFNVSSYLLSARDYLISQVQNDGS